MHAPPLTWLIRLLWLTLPVTLGEVISGAVTDRSDPVVVAVAAMAWLGWAWGLLSSLITAPWALVALRVAAPQAGVAGVAAAIAAPTAPSVLGWFGLATVAVLAVLPLSAEVGDDYINGASYGDERRFPLRPPGALLLGPIPLVWAAVAVPVPVAVLLIAAERWILGMPLAVAGVAVLWWGTRVLVRLTRRWCVFVPAGVTLVDEMALAEPTLMRSGDIAAVGPAPVDTDALDLSAGAAGLILQMDLRAVGTFIPVSGRSEVAVPTEASSILMAPSRPGALLAHARDRGLAVTTA